MKLTSEEIALLKYAVCCQINDDYITKDEIKEYENVYSKLCQFEVEE